MKNRGFTLIELSIVLVIIGLIVGGVLVGRDLIKAAEVRSVVSEVENIKTATNTFRTKYNCLPGDCINATDYFTGTTNGDNNGKIDSFTVSPDGERFKLWSQLAQAGLIAGTYTGTNGAGGNRHSVAGSNVPVSKLGTTIGYTLLYYPAFTGTDWASPCIACKINSHMLMLGASHNNSYETYAPAFSPSIAYAIDSKIDDGLPGLGTTIFLSSPIGYTGCATSNNASTATYAFTDSTNVCSLAFYKFL